MTTSPRVPENGETLAALEATMRKLRGKPVFGN